MADLAKLTVDWTGFPGSPGFTNLYWRNATPGVIDQAVIDNAIAKTDAWLNVWNSRLPANVNVHISNTFEIIDDTNGELQGFMAGTTFGRANGSGTGNYAAAAGAVTSWYTNAVRNGRRIRGRSFIVPLAQSALATDGSLDGSTVSAANTAAAAMHAATGAARLVVWSRPTTPEAADGTSSEVTFASVPDRTAILTSRRA